MTFRWKSLLIAVVAITLIAGWSVAGFSSSSNTIVIGPDGVMGADGLMTPPPHGATPAAATPRAVAQRMAASRGTLTVSPPTGRSDSYTVLRNGQPWVTISRGTWNGRSGVQLKDPAGSGVIRVVNADLSP